MQTVPKEPEKKRIDSDSILIKICTAAAIAAMGFAWNTHAEIAVIKNNNELHTKVEDSHQVELNNIQIYLRDINGRLSKVEIGRAHV